MKASIPHPYKRFASTFTLDSMVKEVAYCAFQVFKDPSSEIGPFATTKKYSMMINNKTFQSEASLVQTWLIDLVYDLICLNEYGTRTITSLETLHLINLYNDYSNEMDKKKNRKSDDVFLYVFGFFGEQKRFQNIHGLYEEFSREKYILDIISNKSHPQNTFGIDVEQDIFNHTGFSSDEYSALAFLIYGYFSYTSPFLSISDFNLEIPNTKLTTQNILKVINKYSITVEQIRNSSLRRQVFYTKPLLKTSNGYISANPFLTLCLFINSNYWLMRNIYKNKTQDPLRFLNAFGIYFEMYVEELLNYCLKESEFKKIPESSEPRADWHLSLGGYDFLIEQKSGLSLLDIKQNQSDLDSLRKHILTNWGEAAHQLAVTESALRLENPIKIILVYEDYYKSECLDELFKLDETLVNDNKYWLVNINEFEMLLYTYKTNPELFMKIVKDKDFAEITLSRDGRELLQFLNKYEVKKNTYLDEANITDRFEIIKNLCLGID